MQVQSPALAGKVSAHGTVGGASESPTLLRVGLQWFAL